MNKLLKRLLPTTCDWLTLDVAKICCSYTEILVVMEKHGHDLEVSFGYIDPKNNYTDYAIKVYQGYSWVIVDKKDVLAISLVPSWYIC